MKSQPLWTGSSESRYLRQPISVGFKLHDAAEYPIPFSECNECLVMEMMGSNERQQGGAEKLNEAQTWSAWWA